MQQREYGYALILSLIALVFISLTMHTLLEDLADVAKQISLWAEKQRQIKVLETIAPEQLNSGIFDYDWQYLGEYPCVQLCQPKCQGTRHWLLSVSYGQTKLHLRVLKPVMHLTCLLPHVIRFNHAVIWWRKI